MPFTLTRRPKELVFRPARLVERTELAPGYIRVRLEGDALRGFDSPGCDDHIRVFFPDADGGSAALSTDELRASPNREYTPLMWDGEAGVLELEFVVHGDEGVAGRWAADAPLAAPVGVGGPRGSLVIDGEPDSWFLAGDETAIPAIRRHLERMARPAVGHVLLEVRSAADEMAIDVPDGVTLEWVHRGDAPGGSALAACLDAFGADDRPHGDVFAFIAAEQSIVKPGRALLTDRWGLDAAKFVVKGYWRRGEAEYHAPH